MSYDVLAVRAQREEASGAKPWPFKFGIEEFELPAEPPADMLPILAELATHLDAQNDAGPQGAKIPTQLVVALPNMLNMLLGDTDARRLATFRLSIQDVTTLLTTYLAESMGGGGLGESVPSPTSSPATPRTPRQTSKRTTGSRSSRTTAAS